MIQNRQIKRTAIWPILFGIWIIFSSCDPEEGSGVWGSLMSEEQESKSYLMVDGARYDLDMAYTLSTKLNGKNYLQLFLFPDEVPYDDFMNGFLDNGAGMMALFDFPTPTIALPAGDYTYLKSGITPPGQGKNFSSCKFSTNIEWWMARSGDLDLLESGTAVITKSNDTYTINISGKDVNGREIKCYYEGTIKEINKVSNMFNVR